MRKNLVNIGGNNNNDYENGLKDWVKPDWMDPSEKLPDWWGNDEWKQCILGTKEDYENCINFISKRPTYQIFVVLSVAAIIMIIVFTVLIVLYSNKSSKQSAKATRITPLTTGVVYKQPPVFPQPLKQAGGGLEDLCRPWCGIMGGWTLWVVGVIVTIVLFWYTIKLHKELDSYSDKFGKDKLNKWGNLIRGGKAPWIMRISNRIFSKLFL